jgi:prevent-host-death family protein
MISVNMHEAKTRLSQLVEAAARGEEVVIARAGRPVARIVPVAPVRPRMADDLGALGRGKSPEEVRKIIEYLEAPWSEEDLDDFLRGIYEDETPAP